MSKLISLSGLSNLEYLNLKSLALEENSLDNLLKLRQLVLIRCDMKALKLDIFDSFPSLESLEVFYSDRNDDDAHLLNLNLSTLKRLDLNSSNNRLKILLNLPPDLRVLKLTDFTYKESCSYELRHIKHSNLEILDLEGLLNMFKENWAVLNFNTNWIEGFTSLKHLRIAESKLRKINLSSRVIQRLTSLSLESNRIEKLDWCKLVNLVSLDLSYNNKLKFVPNMFVSLVKLEQLSLKSANFDGSVHGVFDNLKSLRFLDLSCNRIKKIERRVFEGAENLRELNLGYNWLLDTLEARLILDMFPKLEKLDQNRIGAKFKKEIDYFPALHESSDEFYEF